jgi:hypothetical protein
VPVTGDDLLDDDEPEHQSDDEREHVDLPSRQPAAG